MFFGIRLNFGVFLCFFLQKAGGGVLFPEEFVEFIGFKIVGIGVVIDFFLQDVAYYFLFQIFGHEEGYCEIDGRYYHVQNVYVGAEMRRFAVYFGVPVEIAHCEEEQRALETLYDEFGQLIDKKQD